MKTVQEWKDFCHKNGSAGLIHIDHDCIDTVFDILNDWEQSEKNQPANEKIKRYREKSPAKSPAMSFGDFVEDLTRELKENKDWAKKKVEFCTIDGGGLEYLSVYDLDDTICIDVGTEEDSNEHNKAMVG